jgi:hypothetical protein
MQKFLLGNWHSPETDGTWSSGYDGSVVFKADWSTKAHALQLGLQPLLSKKQPMQKVKIYANRILIGTAIFKHGIELPEIKFPLPNLSHGEKLRITIVPEHVREPREISNSPDSRQLGVKLRWLKITNETKHGGTNVAKKTNEESISFKKEDEGHKFLTNGWHPPEDHGVWSKEDASICLALKDEKQIKSEMLEIKFSITPMLTDVAPMQKVRLYINGDLNAVWKFEKNKSMPDTTIHVLSEKLFQNGKCKLDFKIENPRSPLSDKISKDQRMLGIMLHSLKIVSNARMSFD